LVVSRVVKRRGCQVVEIHHWFLCDGSVIIVLDSSYTPNLAQSADVGVSSCFFIVLEQPLEVQIFIIFSYSVSSFVGFLFPVEESEGMSLFVLNSNSILLYPAWAVV
jgi:hypothetical protein